MSFDRERMRAMNNLLPPRRLRSDDRETGRADRSTSTSRTVA